MICIDCRVAGDFNTAGNYDKAEELHDFCKGDCPCHHKTGHGWVVRRGEKVPPIRVQSP